MVKKASKRTMNIIRNIEIKDIKTIVLVSLVILFTSAQLILIPLVSGGYSSIYFTLLMVCTQFTIISFVIMLIANRGARLPKDKTSVLLCGIFGSLMTILYAYSADPRRTQPVMQTMLSGLRIIPSVLFTKIILKKSNKYDLRFIIPSIVLLLGSIGLTFIPQREGFNIMSALWISMFMLSTVFAALYSIFQERYIVITKDSSNANETVLIFWTRLIQNIIVGSSYWCEYVIGHEHDPVEAFRESIHQFLDNSFDTTILELGILVYLLAYIASTYLNAISTNYSMISSAGAEPIVILFFTVFGKLNTGVHFPWYISLACVILSLGSVYLWIKGESKSDQTKDHITETTGLNPNNGSARDSQKASQRASQRASQTPTYTYSAVTNYGSSQKYNYGSSNYAYGSLEYIGSNNTGNNTGTNTGSNTGSSSSTE